MSPTNFADLVSEHPEFGRAFDEIERWMQSHRDEAINPTALARETESVDPFSLAMALTLLTNEGRLRRVYKVLTPSGVFADGEFSDPGEIPQRLADRWEHYFDTSDSDVIPIYQLVA